MSDGEIILQLGLKEGRNADAATAAASLLAWIDLTRDAARAIDPYADVRVELIGRTEGSLKQVLKLIDDHLGAVSEGADEWPYLKKTAVALALGIATNGLSTFVVDALKPSVQQVALSAKDRELLHGMTTAIEADPDASRAAMRFYRALERDPAITNVEVKEAGGRATIITIDRSEFAMRGGLYSAEPAPPPEETKREVWSVVLMQAPFFASERHWMFSRDGLRFGAKMADARILQAIVDRTLDIGLHEGVRMEVEVEWRERLTGKVWATVPDTRKIIRVLSTSSSPPDLATDGPEEND